MPPKLPGDVDGLYALIEPMFGALNEPAPDYVSLRRRLPAATKTTKRLLATAIEDALVVRGSAVIDGGVELADGAALFVLGDLTVNGALYSLPHCYSFVVVGGAFTAERVHTCGDVIAFQGIRTKLWWARDNDYSAYAPMLDTDLYLATDGRHDIIGELRATTRSGEEHLVRERHPELDPENVDSVRAFLGMAPPKRPETKPVTTTALEAIRAELGAAWALPERIAKVKAVRAVYAKIKKRRLAGCGELLVEAIADKKGPRRAEDWSIQDELHLLADLGRLDLLKGIPQPLLEGYEGWMPGLFERARKASS